ncbi:MAG: hypothetical protein J0I12_06375 [Candidatus Eremiobacteraeota bacterium]|nr:hypothetical protein [Candidatus Eremiobacteraeota bacterium]
MKFGKVKKQHSMLEGLEDLSKSILKDCPHVQRIVPGRISRRKGRGVAEFKVQYPTPAGLKCIYLRSGATQEVFLICSDLAQAQVWLSEQKDKQ